MDLPRRSFALLFFLIIASLGWKIYEFKIDVRSQPLRLLSAAPAQLCAAPLTQIGGKDCGETVASRLPDGPQRGFRHPEDARRNAEPQAVEFGVEIGEYRGVVRVLRRVFQRLLPERPTPERCIEAYFLQRTRFESIAERKLRRRQLTEDGNVEITGRDLRENAGSRRGLLAR